MTDKDTRKPRVDPDGVRVFDRGSDRRTMPLVAAAVLIIGLGAITLLVRRAPVAPDAVVPRADVAAASDTTSPKAAADASTVVRPIRLSRVASAPPPPRRAAGARSAGAAVAPAPEPTLEPDQEGDGLLEGLAEEYIDELRARGETGGLAAFPPPGTNPPKTGLVVPDDYELPEGYVRYHQATDDGKRLEPILMFSPDYGFVDGDGNPIELPDDGIVPPELAPPGLPGRMLEVPDSKRPRR